MHARVYRQINTSHRLSARFGDKLPARSEKMWMVEEFSMLGWRNVYLVGSFEYQ